MAERELLDVKIKRYAQEFGINPEDLAGIMQTESNFRNIMSPVDKEGKRAYGYMQLRSGAMKDLGISMEDVMNPDINIRGGAQYYKWMLDKFGGDRELAMKAYYAGPGFM